MSTITRFQIKKLHGYKNFDLRLIDNTLILVGENGAGKTTVLHLFYYLLSGQWSSMAKYKFDEVSITIGNNKCSLHYSDIDKSLKQIDHRLLTRLPPPIRHKFMNLIDQKEGGLVTAELEMLCRQYDIPLHFLLQELDLFEHPSTKPMRH